MAARLNELKQKRIEASNAFRALLDTHVQAAQAADNRGFTAEEKAAQVAAEAKVTDLDGLIAAEERRLELEAGDVRPVATVDVGKPNAASAPWHREGEASTVGFGRFLQAVHRAHTGNGMDPRLMAAATGMNEAFGPDGGFAVPPEYAQGIEREMFEVGQLLALVDQRTIGGNAITYNVMKETSRVDGSRQGGVLGYWVDEGTAPDPTKIQLSQIEMKLRKVAALGYMTEELQADAAALAGELQSAFRDELIFQVENKIYRGAGAGCPLGFLNAPCVISVAKETNQAAATINTTNLSKMWARLPARSKANAVWLINVDCEPQLDELTIAAGTGAVEPRFVNYGPDGILRIKGRPVIPVEYAETLGTVGDIALVDLSKYRLIRKAAGVEQSSSIHVRFTQGENTYRAIYRVDGQPVPRAAITPFKGTNTLSPFVVLATRS